MGNRPLVLRARYEIPGTDLHVDGRLAFSVKALRQYKDPWRVMRRDVAMLQAQIDKALLAAGIPFEIERLQWKVTRAG